MVCSIIFLFTVEGISTVNEKFMYLSGKRFLLRLGHMGHFFKKGIIKSIKCARDHIPKVALMESRLNIFLSSFVSFAVYDEIWMLF